MKEPASEKRELTVSCEDESDAALKKRAVWWRGEDGPDLGAAKRRHRVVRAATRAVEETRERNRRAWVGPTETTSSESACMRAEKFHRGWWTRGVEAEARHNVHDEMSCLTRKDLLKARTRAPTSVVLLFSANENSADGAPKRTAVQQASNTQHQPPQPHQQHQLNLVTACT